MKKATLFAFVGFALMFLLQILNLYAAVDWYLSPYNENPNIIFPIARFIGIIANGCISYFFFSLYKKQ